MDSIRSKQRTLEVYQRESDAGSAGVHKYIEDKFNGQGNFADLLNAARRIMVAQEGMKAVVKFESNTVKRVLDESR